jgi:hypothetical protein
LIESRLGNREEMLISKRERVKKRPESTEGMLIIKKEKRR